MRISAGVVLIALVFVSAMDPPSSLYPAVPVDPSTAPSVRTVDKSRKRSRQRKAEQTDKDIVPVRRPSIIKSILDSCCGWQASDADPDARVDINAIKEQQEELEVLDLPIATAIDAQGVFESINLTSPVSYSNIPAHVLARIHDHTNTIRRLKSVRARQGRGYSDTLVDLCRIGREVWRAYLKVYEDGCVSIRKMMDVYEAYEEMDSEFQDGIEQAMRLLRTGRLQVETWHPVVKAVSDTLAAWRILS